MADVSYLNVGKLGDSQTVATAFVYNFDYVNQLPKNPLPDGKPNAAFTGESVGSVDGAGPQDAHAGITLMGFGMFDMGYNPPRGMMSWSSGGSNCVTGTKSSPVQQSTPSCAYSSTNSFVPSHLQRSAKCCLSPISGPPA